MIEVEGKGKGKREGERERERRVVIISRKISSSNRRVRRNDSDCVKNIDANGFFLRKWPYNGLSIKENAKNSV